ncbi:dihydroorotate dehydrogenase (quinone) [Campylobacterota bacterium]|nr:dihydroorotate dehydrogenase (quinone) [Campylobacterota bacterium]
MALYPRGFSKLLATIAVLTYGNCAMNYTALRSLLFKLPPETAHTLAETAFVCAQKTPFVLGLLAQKYADTHEDIRQKIFDLNFPNPVGIGAGFDKNGTMIRPLAALGFGFIEIGTATPKPQNGNKKPRLWRHIAHGSLQNAMGFNNRGIEKIAARAAKLAPFAIPIGINLGKNKTTPNENAIADYLIGLEKSHHAADYFVFNISSPNTPNLRDLQNGSFITELFTAAAAITAKPLLLKIAPDLAIEDAVELCNAAIGAGARGIIAANTTNDYSLIAGSEARGGGLSGAILTTKSREFFGAIAKEFFGRTILVSCGGIMDADEAWARIKMGASLVQCYTGFIYGGASFAKSIALGVADRMKSEGFETIAQAIGADRR